MRKFAYFFVFIYCATAFAQIEISGAVSGTWAETELDYWVMGDCYVPGGSTLTILSGVQVQFYDHYDFVIQGALIVQGTETDSVVFRSLFGTTPGSWTGLEFQNILPGITSINYCRIEAADRCLNVDDSQIYVHNCLLRASDLSPVRAIDSDITLSDCVITQGGGSGISLQNSTATVTGCTITYCSGSYGHGINASNGGTLTVVGGYIGNNLGYGVNGVSLGDVVLTQVEIEDNGGYGVSLTFCAELNAFRSIIHHNGYHGLFLSSTSLYASNLTISTNGGSGISCANNNIELTSSIVDRNVEWGIHCQTSSDFLGYNCLFENGQGAYSNCSPGTGAIEDDPEYVSWGNRLYDLTETSPCIDAGSPFDPIDPDGTTTDMGAIFFNQDPVDPFTNMDIINSFAIASTYPNPFNPSLTILLEAFKPAAASLEAWSTAGQLVSTIWEGRLMPGYREVIWNAAGLPSGIYHIRLVTDESMVTESVLLLK
ncbi:right-handed parallel beta-helix repeat-containing protein [bacterium]|nr:right-handed parallel beta-helix repeat-containing protein [bacterium]